MGRCLTTNTRRNASAGNWLPIPAPINQREFITMNNENEQLTCDERIDAQRDFTDEAIREAIDDGSIYELGLGLSWSMTHVDGRTMLTLIWQLSWGGPSDEVQMVFRPSMLGCIDDEEPFYMPADQAIQIDYVFKDWDDGARIGASDIMIERMQELCELCPIMPEDYEDLLADLLADEDEDEDDEDEDDEDEDEDD